MITSSGVLTLVRHMGASPAVTTPSPAPAHRTFPLEIGDLATWVGAAATTGALIAAIVAAVVAHKVYKIESTRDRDAHEQRRRAQAAKVAAWLDTNGREADDEIPALIANLSDLPIFDVYVAFWRPGSTALSDHRMGWAKMAVIPPGGRTTISDGDLVLEKVPDPKDCRASIEFRDAAGIRWLRHADGTLIDLEESHKRIEANHQRLLSGKAAAGRWWKRRRRGQGAT